LASFFASQLLCHPQQFSTPCGIELGEGFDEVKDLGFLLVMQGQWAY